MIRRVREEAAAGRLCPRALNAEFIEIRRQGQSSRKEIRPSAPVGTSGLVSLSNLGLGGNLPGPGPPKASEPRYLPGGDGDVMVKGPDGVVWGCQF